MEIRPQLDLGYKIENHSIIIFEIRPDFMHPEIKRESPVAKTTYVKSKNHWKVFWQRADLKWYPFTIRPVVKTLPDFLDVVDNNEYGCFWG